MYLKDRRKGKQSSGLTLIETIIYVALSGALLAGVVISIYPIFTGAEKMSQDVVRETESLFILQKISWALSSASSVSDSGGQLRVSTPEGNLVFSQNDGAIELNSEPLTSSRVEITDFAVNYTPASGDLPAFVEVEFKADGEQIGPFRKNLYF
jgi:hypothetical protein